MANTVAAFVLKSPVQHDGSFAFFSPQVFYIKDIPCRLVPHEVVLIYMFGILSATLAAVWAAFPLSKLYPAEVLQYDQ
jgi:lipoprotein-releasing system permease protein